MDATMLILVLTATMVAFLYPQKKHPMTAPPVLHSRVAEGQARHLGEMSGVPP